MLLIKYDVPVKETLCGVVIIRSPLCSIPPYIPHDDNVVAIFEPTYPFLVENAFNTAGIERRIVFKAAIIGDSGIIRAILQCDGKVLEDGFNGGVEINIIGLVAIDHNNHWWIISHNRNDARVGGCIHGGGLFGFRLIHGGGFGLFAGDGDVGEQGEDEQ